MRNRLLARTSLLFLLTICFALALQEDDDSPEIHSKPDYYHIVRKRAVGYNNKPGFFRTLFSVVSEQYTDTKNTINKVGDLINNNIVPDNSPLLRTTTPPPGFNGSTTEAPFRLTRSQFLKILRRNLRGLVRLYNIELRDSLKQSDKNYADFRRNLSQEVSKFL